MSLVLPNAKVVADFHNVVPDAFLHDVVSAIWKSYELANLDSPIHPKLRRETRPIQRRGFVDTNLNNLAKKHFNIPESIQSNCTNTHNYTELIIDQKVILTASVVDSPKSLPRASKFRLEAASNNPRMEQLDLFASNILHADFSEKIIKKSKLYGIIIHGPSKSLLPEFIIVVIPDYSYKRCIATINLLERYKTTSLEVSAIDLSVQEVSKPAATLKTVVEEYIEDEEQVAGEQTEIDDGGGEGA